MNNKYYAYSISLIFLITNVTLLPMHRMITYVGIGTLPCIGMINAHGKYNDMKQAIKIVQKNKPVEGKVRLFAERTMKQCNSPVIPFMYGNNEVWSIVSDSVLQAEPSTIDELNKILEKTPETRSDSENRQLAVNTMLEKHEIHHYINRDSMNKVYAEILIPITIQAVASATKCGFNKLLKVQNPKTSFAQWSRSSLTIGTIIPKLILCNLATISYERYLEKNADEFACKHAESRLELEEFATLWKNHEKTILESLEFSDIKHDPAMVQFKYFLSEDPHPYSGKRTAMAEQYLAQWDKKHFNTSK